jgi:hypothetical protein
LYINIQLRHIYVLKLLIMLEISLITVIYKRIGKFWYITQSELISCKCRTKSIKYGLKIIPIYLTSIINFNYSIPVGSFHNNTKWKELFSLKRTTSVHVDYFEPKFDGFSCISIPLWRIWCMTYKYWISGDDRAIFRVGDFTARC